MITILSAEFLASCVSPNQYPRDRIPEFAFIGRSNVGKSSLLNSLVNRKALAKVSGTPGKTQTINFFRVATTDAKLKQMCLVDLPGYGFAKVPQSLRKQWKPMIETYLRTREQLRSLVFLIDVRRIDSEDRNTIAWLNTLGPPVLIVGTKADKLKRSERKPVERQIRATFDLSPEVPIVLYSSQSHEGRRELWQQIRQLAESPT